MVLLQAYNNKERLNDNNRKEKPQLYWIVRDGLTLLEQ